MSPLNEFDSDVHSKARAIFGRFQPARLVYLVGSGLVLGALLYFAGFIWLFQKKGLDSCLPSYLPWIMIGMVGLWAVISAVLVVERTGCLGIAAHGAFVLLGLLILTASGVALPLIRSFCRMDCVDGKATGCYSLARTSHSVEDRRRYGDLACNLGSFAACKDLADEKMLSVDELCIKAISLCRTTVGHQPVSFWDEMACEHLKKNKICEKRE